MRTTEGMTLETLQVMIRAEIEEYQKAMKKVKSETNSTMSSVQAATTKIKSALKGVMKTLGIALSVAAIISFGKACIELGSDLAEVQNVVDVTFGECNQVIEDFAKNAADEFGLSELAAKRYASTMGAMLKSMGITGKQLEDMSIKLAGLAGDIASFYNLDSDDAFAKIRSGISGETEPLKQLGINLSVANMEQFALTQGIKKSYSAMTQQEQALLRYNYLLSVTADAQGDFSRTSDSWANQTRILALRFESLKSTIGQGLTNVLTPVIRVLNVVISKIQVAADAFKRFTEIISGVKASATSVTGVSKAISTASDGADNLTGATKAAGSAAKKTKEAFSGLAKFDEINSLQKNDSSSGGGGAGYDDGLVDTTDAALAAAEETDNALNPALQKVLDKLKEIKELATQGFWDVFSSTTNLDSLRNSLGSIKDSLKNIFTDPEVVNAADNWVNTWAYASGQVAGSVASIAANIATNLVGGIALYLEQNTPRIKDFIVNMFDITADIGTITGNFSAAVANIFSVFRGETAQQVTANIIGIFADSFMGSIEYAAKQLRDQLDVITRPFIDNQEGLKTALEGILEVVETVTGSIKQVVDDYWDKMHEVYDESIAPMYDAIAEGLSDTLGIFLEFWNGSVKPVLDQMAAKFSEFNQKHLTPLLDKFIEFGGSVAEAITALWQGVVKPAIDWIIKNVLPVLLPILQTIFDTVVNVAGSISDIIGGVIEVISGIIDFIVGVFTGDWTKAWEGIKKIFEGNLNAISAFFSLIMNAIAGVASVIWSTIRGVFSVALNAIRSLVTTVFNAIRTVISTIMTGIQTGISTALNTIRTIWTTIWTSVRTTTTTIFNGIWSAIKGVINSILGGVEAMANGVIRGLNSMIRALNNLHFDIPDWVPEIGGRSFGFNITELSTVSLPRLAKGGIVDGPTPLIAGEAGKEAIVPLENNTGWINEVAARVGEILSVNLMGVIESASGNEPIHLTTYVQIDGKTIATQVDQYKNRAGYSMSSAYT